MSEKYIILQKMKNAIEKLKRKAYNGKYWVGGIYVF
jgi:hypothetical protein